MDLEKERNIFWDVFFNFINSKGNPPVFQELTKDRFQRKHSIQVYKKDEIRLMVGVNEEYARCSLHFTAEDFKDIFKLLKEQEADLFEQFVRHKQPKFEIKPNPKSTVVFLRDYGYRFPPANKKDRDLQMEWLFQNAIIMDKIASEFGKTDTKPAQISTSKKKTSRTRDEEQQIPDSTRPIPPNYDGLVKEIYSCTEVCKKPREQMLLGRMISGDSEQVDLMIVGIGPNMTYAANTTNRVVFGEYSPTGGKIRKLIKMIEDKKGAVSCWGTNAIKCDHPKKAEGKNIDRCSKHLLAEIELVKPKVIVLLGAVLSKKYLNKKLVHGGEEILFGKYTCIQSIHPASRNPKMRFDERNIENLASIIEKSI